MVYDIFEHYKNYILPSMKIKLTNVKYIPKRSQRIKNKRRRKSK